VSRNALTTSTTLLFVLLAACSNAASVERKGLVAMDSAGVRIFVADSSGAERWEVAAEPTWSVGGPDDAGASLHQVSDARLLPGGVVAIGNGSTREIILFDPGSGVRARVGGAGDGPAELRSVQRVMPRGTGRVAGFDRERSRVVVFDADGTLVGGEPLPEIAVPFALPRLVPVDEDAYYLAFISGLSDRRTGVFRGDAPLIRVDGSEVDTVTQIPGTSVFTEQQMGAVPFGVTTVVAGAAGGIWVGDQAEPQVSFWTKGPGPERLVRWTDLPDRTLTEQRIDEFVRSGLAALPPGAPRDRVEARLRSLPFPDEVPAYSDVVAADGVVWIGGFVLRALEEAGVRPAAQGWLIVDLVQQRTAHLAAPEGLRITQVGDRWIVGIHRDPLGVETVRRYEVDEVGPRDPAAAS